MSRSRRSTARRLVGFGAALVLGVGAALVVAGPAAAVVPFAATPTAGWRVNGNTFAVKVVGNRVYVGGTFTQAIAPNGTTRPRANLAAFDVATGALIEEFRADTNGSVRALVSDGSTVYAAGTFTTVSGLSRQRVAAVDAATGVVRPFVAQADSTVHALDLRAGRLFVAGSFGRVGGVARPRLAAVNPTTGAVDAQFAPQPNNNVLAVRANPAGSVVYIAGDFTGVGPVGRDGLAALNGVTGAPIAPVFGNTYRPSLGLDMNEDGSRLFVAAGALGNQVQAYNPTTGVRLWRQRADGDVQAVAYHAGTVYFGFHESFETDTRLRMLAADATTGAIDPTFRPVFDLFWGVRAISATDAGLAAGGEFNWVSTVRAQGVVTWRGAGGGPGPQPPTVMLDANTSWRYLAGPSAAPAGWQQPGFADGAWPAGRPQLGYGDGDETTVVPFGPSAADKWRTTYLRASFNLAARPASATLQLLVDDGAVVYLNGTELVRDNMPAGAVTYGTFAATNRSGTAENQFRTFAVDPARLAVGTNTVAVEVHQDAVNSSDLGFDARLS